jgi:hypothetical protein
MTGRPIFTVLRDIQEFSPVEGNWRRLDELLDELWSAGATEGSLPILFGVFERFPQEDGAGVLLEYRSWCRITIVRLRAGSAAIIAAHAFIHGKSHAAAT